MGTDQSGRSLGGNIGILCDDIKNMSFLEAGSFLRVDQDLCGRQVETLHKSQVQN